jgi:hypothetical protein
MNETDVVIALAERVSDVLVSRGFVSALIGSAALAVHGYPRSTQDLDRLANCDREALGSLTEALAALGLKFELHLPGPDDPPDGLIRVRQANSDPIDLVILRTSLGREAVAAAVELPGTTLRVVDLPHLIALKLSAGSQLDRRDVAELLERNPEADRDHIRSVCERFKLSRRFDRVITEMKEDLDFDP